MAVDFRKFLQYVPAVEESPGQELSFSYDNAAAVLYVSFDRTQSATNSEMLDEDTIVRYSGARIIGVTLLHARRQAEFAATNAPAVHS